MIIADAQRATWVRLLWCVSNGRRVRLERRWRWAVMRQLCTAPIPIIRPVPLGGSRARVEAWALVSNTTEKLLKRCSQCPPHSRLPPPCFRHHPPACCRFRAHSRATPHGILSRRRQRRRGNKGRLNSGYSYLNRKMSVLKTVRGPLCSRIRTYAVHLSSRPSAHRLRSPSPGRLCRLPFSAPPPAPRQSCFLLRTPLPRRLEFRLNRSTSWRCAPGQ